MIRDVSAGLATYDITHKYLCTTSVRQNIDFYVENKLRIWFVWYKRRWSHLICKENVSSLLNIAEDVDIELFVPATELGSCLEYSKLPNSKY